MMNVRELGDTLKKLRGRQSLREVSKKTGISHTYLGILEKGHDPRTGKPVNPSPETLRLLAQAYDYPYKRLLKLSGYLEEDPSPHPPSSFPAGEDRIELEMVLQQPDVAYRGKELSPADKRRILDMLSLLFQDTAEEDNRPDREERQTPGISKR